MTFTAALETRLRARVPLIVVTTVEETRAVEAIRAAAEATGRRCVTWDLAAGFTALGPGAAPSITDPAAALEHITRVKDDDMTVFVLKDFHEF